MEDGKRWSGLVVVVDDGRVSMRYLMRQKLFCFGDDFVIKNDRGEDVFYVDGKAISIGNKLSFQDMHGKELAFIRQRLLSFGPAYDIEYSGGVATVKKELFTMFSCKFSVDVPGHDDLEASGNLSDHEYNATKLACKSAPRRAL